MQKLLLTLISCALSFMPFALRASNLPITGGYYALKGECSNMYAQSLDGEIKFLVDDAIYMGGDTIAGYEYSCTVDKLTEMKGEGFGPDELVRQDLNQTKAFQIEATCDDMGAATSLTEMAGPWFYWFTSKTTYTRGRAEQATAYKNGWHVYTEDYGLCYAKGN